MMPANVHPVPPTVHLLRLADVMRRTGLRKTAIYLLQARGEFPRSVQLHGRAVAWRSDEIDQWTADRRRTALPSSGKVRPETETPRLADRGVSPAHR